MPMQLEYLNASFQRRTDERAPDLELTSDANPLELTEEIARAQTIALEFPTFKDGRAFSQARQIRDLGFAGDLRARGALFLDQLQFAIRCGFTSFDFEQDVDLASLNAAAQRYEAFYQTGIVGGPLWEARA